MAFAESTHPSEGRAVSFPNWKAALATAKLTPDRRWQYATEISRFLRYCQILRAAVTAKRSREYLSIVPLVSARPNARLALRWFFQTARVAETCGGRTPADSGRHRPMPAQAARPGDGRRNGAVAPHTVWLVPPTADPPARARGNVNPKSRPE
jgi:hypothetical protein